MTTKEHLLVDGADIQQRIKQIDTDIAELRRQREDLVRQDREEFVARAKEEIGRCYKVNGVCAKILAVPRAFSRDDFPAILLAPDPHLFQETLVPFHEDDIRLPAEPVSDEEFEHEFNRILCDFRQQIGV